ncbi:ribbon-helix-helix protein, CopG family [Pelistega ratti]|uniref:ribbon-helix-helix protein, CopG family n=1 Tax=Pelistega ratti TaxID=2652177 RepID=UPI00135A74D0|nr:ribbon-helix-helix protein, CopG family [Pelistega ratti]
MALSRTELNRRSMEKRGIKQKKFDLDTDTVTLLERVAKETNQPQTVVFKKALEMYAKAVLGT